MSKITTKPTTTEVTQMSKQTTKVKTGETPIQTAERVLADLRQKSDRVAALREKDDRELGAVSYRALAAGDSEAGTKLESIKERALKRDLELKSIASAIVIAQQKLEEAKAAEAAEAERVAATELVKRADRLVALAQTVDDANRVRVEGLRNIADELTEMRSLAAGAGVFVPSHDQFAALGSRAERTAEMLTPFSRELVEYLEPNARRDHISYISQWRDAIVKSAAAFVGTDKSNQPNREGGKAA